MTGLPEEGAEQAGSAGIAVTAAYRPEGSDVVATVTVRNAWTTPLQEVAVVHYLPAGYEVLRTEGGATYQDVRDDAVMSYVNLAVGETKTLVYRLSDTYRGSYRVPAVVAYAMYDEAIRGVFLF
jgi:uncharacterized protein YfaS (alpha-2-macroglobulin family)